MYQIDLNKIKHQSAIALDSLNDKLLYPDTLIGFHDRPKYIANSKQEANYIARKIATDSFDPSFNTPSSGMSEYVTAIWSAETIKQITQKLAFREIGADFQYGTFESNDIIMPTVAYSGIVSIYNDHEEPPTSGYNANQVNRGVIRLSTGMAWGDLEVKTMAAGKIDAISETREAAIRTLTLIQDKIFFNGFAQARNVRGLLTDSDLNPSIPTPASVAKPASGKWKYKTYEEIVADLLSLFTSIVDKMGNNINIDSTNKMILALSPQDQTYLVKPNIYGRTALEYIKSTFPNIRIVTSAQYFLSNADTGNLCQLILEDINGKPVVRSGFTFQSYFSNMIVGMSSYRQKVSTGLGGAIITLPAGIATMTGI